MDAEPSRSSRGVVGTLGWALYLAASWTWCIGLFLPVLLVREYGPWAWVLFAVPNVAGAAAMGFVLRTRDASRAMVEGHWPACAAFSLVTVAFHCFFLGWLTTILPLAWLWVGFPLVALIFLVGLGTDARARASAALVTGLSLLVLAYALSSRGLGEVLAASPAPAGTATRLAMLAPVFFLGFALCPYLDLTFHHARQAATATGARVAFTLGFGVFFLAMIFLTLLYAVPGAGTRPSLYLHLIGMHMLVQAGFTTVLHLRRLLPLAGRVGWAWWGPAAAVAVLLFLLAPGLAATDIHWRGMEGRELTYWLFMAPYGLVFPAYVWLVMIPGPEGVTRARRLTVLGVAVLAALPLFWMGFIEKETHWLLPGLGVVLLSRLLLGRWW